MAALPDTLNESQKYDQIMNTAIKVRHKDIGLAQQMYNFVLEKTNGPGFGMQYARALGGSARLYGLQGNNEKMLENYLAAIDVYQGLLNDTLNKEYEAKIIDNISVCYNNLAQIYVDEGENEIALEFYKNSLQECIKLEDSLGISIRCYNMAIVYNNLKQFDSAFHYMEWSRKIETAMNSAEGLAYAHEGIANIYDNQNEYLKALIHIDSALSYFEFFSDELFKMEILFKKSRVLYNIGGLAESANVLTQAHDMARNVGYKSFQLDAAKQLSEVYFELEEYKKSVIYARIQIEIMNEISAEETDKKVEEFKVQYQSDQKDKEIEQLALQNTLKEEANNNLLEKQKAVESRNRLVYWSLGGGIVLISFIGVLIYINSARRKRINKFLVENNKNLALKNEQILKQSKLIGDSINYAQNIQRAILPTTKEMNDNFKEHFVLFQPKDVVSGDFYWMYKIPDSNQVLFSVADCTGHGVPGAFMSIVGHALLEKIAKQLKIYEPASVLNQLATELQNTLKRGEDSIVDDGMDIALILVDYDSNTISFSAARNPILFVRNGLVNQFKGDRIDIGKQTNVSFNQEQIKFEDGDQLYMFTDGFIDQKGGPDGKKYYIKNFRDFIEKNASSSISEQKNRFNKEFNDWKGQYEQLDDTLVIGIKF